MRSTVVPSRRAELLERRAGLARAISTVGATTDLQRLMDDVDATLARYDDGSYGVCAVCQDPIQDELLDLNPMSRYCLCQLSPKKLEALDRDLTLAAKIQSGLLPRQDVSHAGWSTHYRYFPAGHVGGDYVDLAVRGRDDSLLFLLGDVSGKGVAASFLMAHLSSLLRGFVDAGLSADRLIERANRVFAGSTIPGQYATLVCGRAGSGGEVEISNAGHLPTLLVREGTVESVGANGLPVGLFGEGSYDSCRVQLVPGESLFLYTDGLTEARDDAGNEYGIERLSAALLDAAHSSPGEMAAWVLGDVRRFSAPAAAADDTTVLVVQRAR